jgi:hypothetical protein
MFGRTASYPAPTSQSPYRYGTSTFQSDMDQQNRQFTKHRNLIKALTFIIFGLTAVVGLFIVISNFAVQNTYTSCTVTRAETTVVGTGKSITSQKRIYAQGCNGQNEVFVFTADDNILSGQYRSADTYGSIQEGHTYDFQTRGMRTLSTFPNITSVTSVTSAQ